MGVSINLNAYRRRKQHSGQLHYEETANIKEKYEIATAIIDELFVQAEKSILECGFNPADFELIDEYADELLKADLGEFFAGGEEALSLAYKAKVDGVYYAVDSFASIEGDYVIVDTVFVKYDGSEWLAYEDGAWVQGPGPDFI